MRKRKTDTGKYLRWIWRENVDGRKLLYLLMLASLGQAAVNLITASVLKMFTDHATGAVETPLVTIGMMMLAVTVAEGGFWMIQSLCGKLAYSRMERRLRLRMMEAVGRGRLIDYQRLHPGEVLTRMTKDVEAASNCMPSLIISLLNRCVSAIGALAYMFVLSWKVSLAIVIAVPLLIGLTNLFAPKLQAASETDKENEDRNRAHLQDALGNMPLIKTYRAQPFVAGRLREAYAEKYRSYRRLGVLEGLFSFAGNLVGTAMFIITLGYGALLASQGEFSVGGMIAVIQLLNYVVWPLSSMSDAISEANQALTSARRIDEVLALPAEQDAKALPHARCAASAVVVRSVDFAYDADAPVLSGACVEFPAGSVTGVYGRSGSGKSTLLRLLLGLYAADAGGIELVLADGSKISGAAMNCLTSYVPSDGFVYAGTVRENILMGAETDEERLWQSAEIANIAEMIRGLPHGMDERIGSGGQGISSGQAQRIAIARAIYRDAPVLILDEPTSNLDQASIALLKNTLDAIGREKIVIMVTHERSMMEICDALYLLHDGRLEKADSDTILHEVDTTA